MAEIDKDKTIPPESPIVVDKGVPIPASRTGAKYPFKQMEVGDSFFFTDKLDSIRSLARNIRVDGVHYGFVVRADGIGWRIWRVK